MAQRKLGRTTSGRKQTGPRAATAVGVPVRCVTFPKLPPNWGKVAGHEDVFPGPRVTIDPDARTITEEPSALDQQVGGDHYRDCVFQPIVFCHRNRLGPCESAVVKYMCRHKNKGRKQDLLKAAHYIQILIDLEYPEYTSGDIPKPRRIGTP